MARLSCLALLTLFGCGEDARRQAPSPETPGSDPCPLDALVVDEQCLPKGLPDDLPCAPGEQLVDATCVPAGVPPSRCPEGFEPRDEGCDAILPDMDCPPGQMALPGETTCRPVAPCPSEGWGDAPVEAGAIYVDAGFQGMSDGSQDAPWPTIQEAVDAAEDGALVLVAPGSYAEQVVVAGKGVRLWGTCPTEVTLEAPAEGVGAFDVIDGADGTEIHRIGISGARVGVGSSGATDVLLEAIWVHDTGDQGLLAEDVIGPSSMTVRGSLVEGTGLGGFVIAGAGVTLEDSVLRNTGGRGVDGFSPPSGGSSATMTIEDVVIHNAVGGGIVVAGSEVSMRRVVVQDTVPDASGQRGWGVAMFDVPGLPATEASLTDAVVERSHGAGVIASATTALVEGVTVREVAPNPVNGGALGMAVDAWAGTSPDVTAVLRQSLIADAAVLGLFLSGTSDATIEGVAVRDVTASAGDRFGWGVAVQWADDLAQPARAVMRDSMVKNTVGTGIFVYGSSLTLETTVVEGTASQTTGRHGAALTITEEMSDGLPSTVQIWASVLTGNAEAGVVIAGSQASVDQSDVASNLTDGLGAYGDGLLVFGTPRSDAAHLDLSRSRVVSNARAGVACFGATAAIADTLVACHDYALNAEVYLDRPGTFDDLGGNACGCDPLETTCKAVSSSLEPPQPIEDPYEPGH